MAATSRWYVFLMITIQYWHELMICFKGGI